MVALWSGLASLAGCGIFSPDEDPQPPVQPPIKYEIPSLPGFVLNNLIVAYTSRDSSGYKDVYDSTYTGTSIDLNDTGTSIDLVYDDEIAHIRALASTPTVTNTLLDFGPSSTWKRLPSDDPSHPEWALIQISGSNYRVEVTDGQTTYGAIGEGGTFQEFAFNPTLESASPTDTLWKIVRWKETGRSQPTL